MAYDGYSKQSLTSIASKPSERESCRICKKFVYFHQPILLCTSCCKVFHGICLKMSNVDVFVFQQILWYCPDCRSRDNNESIHVLLKLMFILRSLKSVSNVAK